MSTILAHLETSEELVATAGTYASVWLDKRAVVPSFLPIEFQDACDTATLAHLEGRLIGAEAARLLRRQLTSKQRQC